MEGRGGALAIGAAALVAIAALGLYAVTGRDEGGAAIDPGENGAALDVTDASSDDGPSANADSPFSVASGKGSDAGAVVPDATSGSTPIEPSDASASASSSGVAPLAGYVDVATLGREDLGDDAFEALVARLRSDPDLLSALVDEFRAETDPARLRRLTRLLGDVPDPSVTALAAELVYSGDEVSRAIGLDLLGRVQPGSREARDIVSGLLSTETDERVLVPTLQALSRAGAVDRTERAALSGQVALLTSHEQPNVRRLGVDILARWSDGQAHVPVFRDALSDRDAGVRETAAYSLVGRGDPDGTITRELFAVVENDAEEERVRRGAMLALKQLPLDGPGRERVAALQKQLDRRPLR